jgi:phosphatidylglycerophosphatase A
MIGLLCIVAFVRSSGEKPGRGIINRLAYNLATNFGLGDRLPAPGTTAGSFPAAFVWGVGGWFLGPSWWFPITTILIILAVIAGFWSAEIEIERRGEGDPKPVVIDKVAGQWIAFSVASIMLERPSLFLFVDITVMGFLLFRFFDILKPWPVRALEHLPGALGVMADDLLAGVLAGLTLILLNPLFFFVYFVILRRPGY